MRKFWFSITICILMYIAAALLYEDLPDQIAVHFALDGTIDAYQHKIFVFSIPTLTLGVTLVNIIMPRFDPRKANYKRFEKSYGMYINIFTVFMAGMFGITIYASYDPNALDVPMLITLAIGLMFTCIGNMMPKFRWNYFIGIRCPWTLDNEKVWFLTHLFAGRLWMVGGLLMMVIAFLPPVYKMIGVLGITLVISFVPMLYAYKKYKQLEEK